MEKRSKQVRLLCLAGVMAALYVVLDFVAVSVSTPFGGNLKISLSGLPVVITAVFGGALWGGATGFVGALIGQLLSYGFGPTTLFWVLPAVGRGISMGLLFRAFGGRKTAGVLVLENSISSLLVTVLNTGAMAADILIYGADSYYASYYAILAGVPLRVLAGLLTAVLFSLMLPTVIQALDKNMK